MKTGVHQPQSQARCLQEVPHRLATPELSERAPARCPRSRSTARCAPLSVAPGSIVPGRQPRFQSCCCHPAPSIPPRPSPGTPPSSSWPSLHSAGCSSPPRPAPHAAPICPAVRRPPANGLVGEEYLGSGPVRLVPQGGVLRHEGLPLGGISLEQAFLGPLQHESQAVQPVQATASAQANTIPLRDELTDHLPIPVGQFDSGFGRRLLHCRFQIRLLRLAEGGGEPPDCSNIKASGPPPPKAAAHRPMVWKSRSSALAVSDAVQPWASSNMAYHRSRSRGVGARIIRRRKSLTPICHFSRNRSISLTPITSPCQTPEKLTWSLRQFTPCCCAFHLGFGLGSRGRGGQTQDPAWTRESMAGVYWSNGSYRN